MKVKVITLKQPWAYLVAIGAKQIETRSWQTQYRGELYIHSSAKIDFNDLDLRHFDKHFAKFINNTALHELHLGCIVGKVDLFGIESTNNGAFLSTLTSQEKAFGDYNPDRFGWLLRNPVKFDKPISAKGKLSVWEFELDEKEVSHA